MSFVDVSTWVTIKWDGIYIVDNVVHLTGWSFSIDKDYLNKSHPENYVVSGNLSAKRFYSNSTLSNPICLDWIPADSSIKKFVKNFSLPILANHKYNLRFTSSANSYIHGDKLWSDTDFIMFKFISQDHSILFEATYPIKNNVIIEPDDDGEMILANKVIADKVIENPPSQPIEKAASQPIKMSVISLRTCLPPPIPTLSDKKRKRNDELDESVKLNAQQNYVLSDISLLKELLAENTQKLSLVQDLLNNRIRKNSEIKKHIERLTKHLTVLQQNLQ